MLLNRSSISICLLILLAGASSVLVGLSSLYLYLSPNLPSVESLRNVKFKTPLRIYSADDKLIGEYGVRRQPIPLEEMSPVLIKAFLAAEDDSFYSHNGFDVGGIVRATSQYLLQGGRGTGGSTLTMQVAKMCFMASDTALRCSDAQQGNPFLTNNRSLLYKAVQILLALRIEEGLTKDEILEIYLNQIFLGHRSYGIQAAAQTYYGKDVRQVSLAEAAVIAGIPPGPTIYNPVSHPQRAINRRSYVLRRMLDLDYIDQAQFDEANAQPITAKLRGTDFDLDAPYIREMVRIHMNENYGEEAAFSEGYSVYTTIDSRMQRAAHDAVIDGLIAYDQRHGFRPLEAKLEPVFYQPSQIDLEHNEEELSSTDEEFSDPETQPRLYPPTASTSALATLVPSIENSDEAPNTEQTGTQQLHLDPWIQQLQSIPTYGNFQPAAIVKAETSREIVTDESGAEVEQLNHEIEAVLDNGDIISIPWKNIPSRAGRYIDVNRYGVPYKDTGFLNVGDVVRVLQRRDKEWYLVQIPEAQAAFVALNPNNGAVKALVGGFDYNYSTWNRVYQAERQPGSNFKPMLYAIALEQGFTPASIINDAPYTIDYDKNLETSWRPGNSGDKYRGPIRLREALYRSINNVAIRILDEIGTSVVIRNVPRFGIDVTNYAVGDMSIALGTQVARPWDIANAYAVFANGGYKVENYYIDRIELDNDIVYQADFPVVCRECEKVLNEQEQESDADNFTDESLDINADSVFDDFLSDVENIEEEIEPEAELPTNIAPRVMDERIVFLMHDMMRDVIQRGTATRARVLNRNDIAGKTGTTNDNSNTWFSGYNSDIVASAWVGFDQNTTLGRYEEGGVTALPIWINFMRAALLNTPDKTVIQPPGVVRVRINPKTGLRTHNATGVMEYFLSENIPPFEEEIAPVDPIFDNDDVDAPIELF